MYIIHLLWKWDLLWPHNFSMADGRFGSFWIFLAGCDQKNCYSPSIVACRWFSGWYLSHPITHRKIMYIYNILHIIEYYRHSFVMFRENHHPMSFWMEKKSSHLKLPSLIHYTPNLDLPTSREHGHVWPLTARHPGHPGPGSNDRNGGVNPNTVQYQYWRWDTTKRWHHIWLVVEPPLWNIWKSNGIIVPNLWKSKTYSKPPTRHHMGCKVAKTQQYYSTLQY